MQFVLDGGGGDARAGPPMRPTLPWENNKIVTAVLAMKKMAETDTFKTTKDVFPIRLLPIMGKEDSQF